MKTFSLFVFVSVLSLAGADGLAANPVMENTPEKLAKGVYKIPLTELVLLSLKDKPEEQLALLFTRYKDGVGFYKWLYFNPLTKDWVTGNGRVQEVYDKVPMEGSKDLQVVPVPGHNTKIQAGAITIEWSRGGADGSWIYFNPKEIEMKTLPAGEFGKVAEK